MIDDSMDRLRSALADRYDIVREVGSGGMATVYLATDIRHQRRVALKVLRPELSATMGPERFLQEVRVTANLQHPHILPLFDSGEAGGFLYYVMPFVDGESLRDRLTREGELPVAEAARLMRDVVDALASAHALGIVHRDVKPENILLSGRHAMVTDFGVAKAVSEATGRHKLTTLGVALGTPAYMAPEQAAADPHIDHRADIYAVGAVAYELLTGKPPFAGRTPQQVLAAQVTEEPAPVTEHRHAVPPGLETLVMRCLEKKPADRWQKAEEMLPHLEAFATPSGGVTPTQMLPVAANAGTRRWGRVGIGVLVAAAALSLLSLWPRVATRLGSDDPQASAIDPALFAVLPFRVSVTDPSLSYLREGMVDLLHVKLASIRRSVEPRTVLDAWRKAGGGDADPSLESAVGIARRVSAGRVLLGSLVGSPDQLTLSASLYEVPAGEELATASVSGPASELPALIDRLAAEILSLEAGEREDRLETFTSTSLPALRAYLDGMAFYRRGLYAEATESFVEAVKQDSTFALAALYMGDASAMAVRQVPGATALATSTVRSYRDRLSPGDRAYSLVRYPDAGTTIPSLQRWESAIDALRDRPEAWYNYGDVLLHQGASLGVPDFMSRAKDAFGRALALDSANFNPLHHLIWIALSEGDTAFAAREMRERLGREPSGRIADEFRWSLALLAGDTAEIRRQTPPLESVSEAALFGFAGAPNSVQFTYGPILTDEQPWGFGWDPAYAWGAAELLVRKASTPDLRSEAFAKKYRLALNFGRPAEAERVLRDAVASLPQLAQVAERERIHAAVYWEGDSTAAAAAAERLSAVSSPAPADVYAVATWRLARGETAGVRETIAALRASGAPATDTLRALLLETRLAHLTNDARAGTLADALEAGARNPLAVWEVRAQANLSLVQIFEKRGELERALAVSRRVLQSNAGDTDRYASSFLRAQGGLAAALGLRRDAIRAYGGFLSLTFEPERGRQQEADRIRAEVAALKAGRSGG